MSECFQISFWTESWSRQHTVYQPRHWCRGKCTSASRVKGRVPVFWADPTSADPPVTVEEDAGVRIGDLVITASR